MRGPWHIEITHDVPLGSRVLGGPPSRDVGNCEPPKPPTQSTNGDQCDSSVRQTAERERTSPELHPNSLAAPTPSTISRDGVTGAWATDGGLPGAPLLARASTRVGTHRRARSGNDEGRIARGRRSPKEPSTRRVLFFATLCFVDGERVREIDIWQHLDGGAWSSELAAALDAASRGPLDRKVLLPLAPKLLRSAEPEARAIGCALLGGHARVPALILLVAALDDEHASVRFAAVQALAECTATTPMRFVHALLHPRPDVRATAVACVPDGARVLLAWVRADPELSSACQGAPWPEQPLPLMLDLWRRGVITPAEAIDALTTCTVSALRDHLLHGEQRREQDCGACLQRVHERKPWRDVPGRDACDELLRLVIIAAEAGTETAPVWGALASAVDEASGTLRQRAAVSVLVLAHAGTQHPRALQLACHADLRVLLASVLPTSARRAAARTLVAPMFARRASSSLASAVLASEVVDDPAAGGIDLRTAASVASTQGAAALSWLYAALGPAAAALAGQQLEGWDEVCRLPPSAVRVQWLGAACELAPAAAGPLRAIAALRLRDDLADVGIETLPEPGDAVSLALSCLSLGDREPWASDIGAWERLWSRLALHRVPAWLAEVLPRALRLPHDHVAARALVAMVLGHATAATIAVLDDDGLVELRRRADALGLDGDAISDKFIAAGRRRADPRIAAWSAADGGAAPSAVPRSVGIHRLTPAQADRIASCDDDELEAALHPALAAPCFGLTDALARRTAPSQDALAVCVALVGCVDGIDAVARELARFGSEHEPFVDALRLAVVTLWRDVELVPPLVDAMLVAFERNAAGFATWLTAEEGGWSGVLARAVALPSSLARSLLWQATASVLLGWWYHRRARELAEGFEPAVVELCVGLLDTELGVHAARVLVTLLRAGTSGGAVEARGPRVVALLPGCTREVHQALAAWLPVRGVPSRDAPARRTRPALPADLHAELRASDDLGHLARACTHDREALVHAAVLRLLELGEAGELRLVALLRGRLRHADVLVDGIALWSSAAALAALGELRDDESLGSHRRWRVAIALVERDRGALDGAVALLARPALAGCSRSNDFGLLLAACDDASAAEVLDRIAAGVDPLLADAAMRWWLAQPGPRGLAGVRRALRSAGATTPALRREAAAALLAGGDAIGLPLLIRWAADPEVALPEVRDTLGVQLRRADGAVIDAIVELALLGGPTLAPELRTLDLLEIAPAEVRARGVARLLVEGSDVAARRRISAGRLLDPERAAKLHELARSFAWGVMRARELTGKRFAIHITPKREQWGFTHMGTTAVHVTPLPILERVRHGRDIVEGLILHELGHHIWHGAPEGMRVWRRAKKERLHQLLNLVADEHLERNLRSMDAEFGDRIKRLDAHAFGHAPREIAVLDLLRMLNGAAIDVFAAVRPAVAFDEASVRVESGRLLAELDRVGHSFARFVRALRMGLGDRSGDPLVATALTYFGTGFRQLDMHGLMRVTRALARLFGGDALLAHGFGGHESLRWNERDADVAGDGIADADVQREVERILEPPRASHGDGAPRRLAINVGAGDSFKPIDKLERVPPDEAAHRAIAAPLQRPALRLRETLVRLGLAHVRSPARVRGHALDRARVLPLVTRGDPRMLIARTIQPDSDLFLGVLVDCSGSMSGANLDRARRFAVLVAEAARGLNGVDARFFGFTDKVIYEAGDARRCAVSSLRASDGNNDAAALTHVASVATASHRKSKLLVMISDGLPTECSVSALRQVVQQLTRRHHMCCAQVAVRPLTEICFPNYVLLDDANLDASVRRFGDLIGKLVGRALAM